MIRFHNGQRTVIGWSGAFAVSFAMWAGIIKIIKQVLQ